LEKRGGAESEAYYKLNDSREHVGWKWDSATWVLTKVGDGEKGEIDRGRVILYHTISYHTHPMHKAHD
jgi:hypothetical protein